MSTGTTWRHAQHTPPAVVSAGLRLPWAEIVVAKDVSNLCDVHGSWLGIAAQI